MMVVEAGAPHLSPAMVGPVMPITRSYDSGIRCYFVIRITRQTHDGTTTESRGFVVSSVFLQQALIGEWWELEIIVDIRRGIVVEIDQLLLGQ
jgi:hypothetical protein